MATGGQPRLAIVTTCSAAKQAAPGGTVYLKDIPADLPAVERANRWIEHLDRAPYLSIEVEKLYRGPHWTQSRKTYEHARQRFRPSFWVLSAGYGLIPADRNVRVKPYQATFSQADPAGSDLSNTVSPANLDRDEQVAYDQAWWRTLSDWKKSFSGLPRTLEELVAQDDLDGLLVIGSEHYLRVVEDDLRLAASRLYRPDRLAVVSAGVSDSMRRRLSNHVLTFDARMAQKLGGALGSLNARVAAWLLDQLDFEHFTHSSLQALLDQELAGLEKAKLPPRESQTPDQVRAYLSAQSDIATASPTALLRRFRNEDLKSFEEKHFKRLVQEAKEGFGKPDSLFAMVRNNV